MWTLTVIDEYEGCGHVPAGWMVIEIPGKERVELRHLWKNNEGTVIRVEGREGEVKVIEIKSFHPHYGCTLTITWYPENNTKDWLLQKIGAQGEAEVCVLQTVRFYGEGATYHDHLLNMAYFLVEHEAKTYAEDRVRRLNAFSPSSKTNE